MTAASENSIPASIQEDDSFKAAAAFMRDFETKEGKDYEWLSAYAKTLWDDRIKHFSTLDEKADSIIKYLGGGLGLFSLGVLAKIDSSSAYLLASAFPAIGFAVGSLFCAVMTRRPIFSPSLPSVENAVRYAEAEKNGQAAFLGQWHLACEGVRLANRIKASWLKWATRFYFVALSLLTLPLIVAFFCRG